ncbi:MAG: SHOCT domain-containing protein [Acidimicrobiia bacterium]|nr:SHOCT domain-containing protein [Acidimicrobiia bacterium]
MARRILAGFLIAFAMIGTALTPVVWIVYDLTIDTSTLMSKAEELTTDKAIRRAINTAFVTAVFSVCEEDGKTTTKQADEDCTPVVQTWIEDAGQGILDAITDGDVKLPAGAAAAAAAGAQNGVLSLLNNWNYSETLAPVWQTALESTHGQLTDPDSDEVTLGLHELLTLLQKEGLVTSGLSSRIEDLPIPEKYTTYVLFTREQVPIAWQAVEWVRMAAWVVPLFSAVFLACGLIVSPSRWRLLGTYGIGVTALATLLLWVLWATEGLVVSGIPTAVWRDAAQAAWDILVATTLRVALIWTAVIFAVVALVSFILAGEENRAAIARGFRSAATGIREGWDRLFAKGREIAERHRAGKATDGEGTEDEPAPAGAESAGTDRREPAGTDDTEPEPAPEREPVDVGLWIQERMPILLLAGGGVFVLMFLFWPEKNATVFLVLLLLFAAYGGALYAVERFELTQHLRPAGPRGAVPEPRTPPGFDDRMAAIERLSEMHAKGVLTDDEFADQKTRLLDTT